MFQFFSKGNRLPILPLLMLLLGAGEPSWTTDNGHFRVAYSSDLDPVPINQIHAWTLRVETPEGEPVADAVINIDGGMPVHDHGLPTRPEVTDYLGNGDYRIQGLRFHMMGEWEISVSITAGDVADIVVIPLAL